MEVRGKLACSECAALPLQLKDILAHAIWLCSTVFVVLWHCSVFSFYFDEANPEKSAKCSKITALF